ncbi:MAG: hypothetical protein HOP33_11960 [Verrucomicrobia bacterium]|nr:hypothetical protein [Verrucomicrobiota bacterium]
MHRIVSIVIGLMLVLVSGCDRKPSVAINTPASTGATGAASNENLIARFHWLGKSRLAGETNAARFMSIWNMPESTALENQTLNKLALAPWRLTRGDAATNGAPTAQMRGLLDDLVQAEWYLEVVRDVANQPGQVALAVRMDPERAALWKTNLASVVESLCGSKITAETDGWSLHYKTPDSGLLQFVRAGDWTLVGLAHGQNALLGEFRARIGRDHAPYAARTTNYWLDANVDLVQLNDALALGWKLPAGLPRIKLTEIGDGENVRTRGELVFPKPLDLKIERWRIPTNLVHDPLVSFTACQGIKPLLTVTKAWRQFNLAETPNQVFFWALGGAPFQSYFAAPLSNNQVSVLVDWVMNQGNLWIADNGMGKFNKVRGAEGIRWFPIPFMQPFFLVSPTNEPGFICGGFFPDRSVERKLPSELLYAVFSRTNLVYYDWELTKDRLEGWNGIGQILRLSTHHGRIPQNSASTIWIRAAKTNMNNAVTAVLKSDSHQLTFSRASTTGFTGIEIHFLADWLESKNFPYGFHTMLAAPEILGGGQPGLMPPNSAR